MKTHALLLTLIALTSVRCSNSSGSAAATQTPKIQYVADNQDNGVTSVGSTSSTDLGSTFLADALPSISGITTAKYKSSGSKRLALMSDGSVYSSTDNGQHYSLLNFNGDPIDEIALSGSTIAVLSDRAPFHDQYYLLVSADGGLSFSNHNFAMVDPALLPFITLNVDGSNIMMSFAGGTYFQILVSKDLGSTFRTLQSPLFGTLYNPLIGLSLSGNDVGLMFQSGPDFTAAPLYTMVSHDVGQTFSTITPPTLSNANTPTMIAVSGNNVLLYYPWLPSDNHLMLSTNAGATYTEVPLPADVVDLQSIRFFE